MNKKIKVLINSMGGGGAERQISYLYKAQLIEKIFLLQNDCSYDIEKKDMVPLLGEKNCLGAFGIIKSLLLGPIKISSQFKKHESVLSFLELSNFINILSKVFTPHTAIVSVRISPHFYDNKKLGFLYKALMRILYPYAHKIITNSEQCRMDLLDLLDVDAEKVVVVRNALDLERINLLNNERIEAPAFKYNFVSIGRLSYQKNFSAMIKIFSKLRMDLESSRLVIIGAGEDKENLIELCGEESLMYSEKHSDSHADVVMMGFQENPYKFINKDSIFLLTSHYEGLPNVVLEAMSCGALIIASDCKTGPREILTDGDLQETLSHSAIEGENGLLLPIPTSEDLYLLWKNEIVKLVNDSEVCAIMKANSLNKSRFYGLEEVLKEWSRELS